MDHPLLSKIKAAAAGSELIRAVRAVQRDGGRCFALGNASVRPLLPSEIEQLERDGNTAEDWSRVRVTEDFNGRRIRGCSFQGDVILGRLAGKVSVGPNAEMAAGLYHCTFSDCVIGHDVLIRDVHWLGRYVIGARAVLWNCGSIGCDGPTCFGNGQAVPLALETGGRDVRVFAEIDVETAATVAACRSSRAFLEGYKLAVAEYAAQVTCSFGIIEAGAMVRDTTQVRNTYLGPHARVVGATLLADTTVLSSQDEPTEIRSGACVSGCLLQWGSRADTLAVVENSVLTEHSHVERHGKVIASLLGPNTAVAAGEVVSSLVGPFVGFHHQALLIAALWPEGKGNVAYGANAGSNHTSRAPDQEFRPGEGAFLGLGVNIKFPADFSQSPYTVLAPGITTLPQRLAFPFSLVNSPAAQCPGVPPAYNEILPAWMLTDNLFALLRNQEKYRARNRAHRAHFEFEVFRADIVDLMRDACRRLVAAPAGYDVYTDRHILGLG
jgi:hypothetical protein